LSHRASALASTFIARRIGVQGHRPGERLLDYRGQSKSLENGAAEVGE
jgi:hypothetical protein